MTPESMEVISTMQKEIETLQSRVLNSTALKEMDQQMQDRITTLVDNSAKLNEVQRKQMQQVLAKVDELEASQSLLTEQPREQMAQKIEQLIQSEAF